MPWFSPTGQPIENTDTTANSPPTQNIVGEGGTPLFVEDVVTTFDGSLKMADTTGGKEASMSYDSYTLLGKDIDQYGIKDTASDKFLMYSKTSRKWELTTSSSTINALTDIGDVDGDPAPITNDLLRWMGTEWKFVNKLGMNNLATPIGDMFTGGSKDSPAEMRLQGGAVGDKKRFSFAWTNAGTYTEQWSLGVESATELRLRDKAGATVMAFNDTANTVVISDHSLQIDADGTQLSALIVNNSSSLTAVDTIIEFQKQDSPKCVLGWDSGTSTFKIASGGTFAMGVDLELDIIGNMEIGGNLTLGGDKIKDSGGNDMLEFDTQIIKSPTDQFIIGNNANNNDASITVHNSNALFNSHLFYDEGDLRWGVGIGSAPNHVFGYVGTVQTQPSTAPSSTNLGSGVGSFWVNEISAGVGDVYVRITDD